MGIWIGMQYAVQYAVLKSVRVCSAGTCPPCSSLCAPDAPRLLVQLLLALLQALSSATKAHSGRRYPSLYFWKHRWYLPMGLPALTITAWLQLIEVLLEIPPRDPGRNSCLLLSDGSWGASGGLSHEGDKSILKLAYIPPLMPQQPKVTQGNRSTWNDLITHWHVCSKYLSHVVSLAHLWPLNQHLFKNNLLISYVWEQFHHRRPSYGYPTLHLNVEESPHVRRNARHLVTTLPVLSLSSPSLSGDIASAASIVDH